MIIIKIIIDNHLDFSAHVSNICEIANQKLNALLWVSANMNSDKWTLLINYFIKSHFSCCSLIWMFCYRKRTKNVNKKQGPYLRLMTNNNELSYEELLHLTWALSAPTLLKSLMNEVYKCLMQFHRTLRMIHSQFQNISTILDTIQ